MKEKDELEKEKIRILSLYKYMIKLRIVIMVLAGLLLGAVSVYFDFLPINRPDNIIKIILFILGVFIFAFLTKRFMNIRLELKTRLNENFPDLKLKI